jgi:hypothetical protein
MFYSGDGEVFPKALWAATKTMARIPSNDEGQSLVGSWMFSQNDRIDGRIL